MVGGAVVKVRHGLVVPGWKLGPLAVTRNARASVAFHCANQHILCFFLSRGHPAD